jgi:DNA-binding MarR family transcriptional regulator
MANMNGGLGPVRAGQEGVGFLISQASRALQARIAEKVSQYGLDMDRYTVLRHVVREISAYPDGVSVEGLSSKLNIPASVIEGASVRLQSDGWLETSATGFELLMVPTHRALAQAPVLTDASRWMLEEALNGFSREEIEDLTALLNRVLRNLRGAIGEDEGPLVS